MERQSLEDTRCDKALQQFLLLFVYQFLGMTWFKYMENPTRMLENLWLLFVEWGKNQSDLEARKCHNG